jgi:hypothetical protein
MNGDVDVTKVVDVRRHSISDILSVSIERLTMINDLSTPVGLLMRLSEMG